MPHQGIVWKPLQQIDREEIATSGNTIAAVVRQGFFLAGCDALVNVVGNAIRRNTLRYCALRGLVTFCNNSIYYKLFNGISNLCAFIDF